MINDSLLEPSSMEMNELQRLFRFKKFNLLENEVEKLIFKFPNSSSLQNIFGVSLQAQGKLDLSIEAYKKAIHLKPTSYLAHFNLGRNYKEVLNLTFAEKSYKKCLDINPDYIDGYIGLGLIQLDLHKLEEAISTFKQALKIQPLNTILHRHLSEITNFSEKNSHIKTMEQIILSENTNEDQKMHLHFALGKAYEDIKLYDEAFDCWKKGNIIIRKKINYSTQKQENFFENLKNIFSEKLFKQFKNTKKNKEKIIFIIGMPRSGTTLVQQILSSHPDVVGLGESILFTKMVQTNFYERKGDLVQDISKLNKETLVKIGEDFLKKVEQIIYSADNLNNKKHILIKDPLNFRWMGFIKLIFPNAKVINCTRNPFDNCVSLYKTFFTGGVDFSYNLSELGLYYNFYLDLMNFWEKKIPEFFENISYENIINNREHETRKLLNYCNLQWHENCMQSHKYVHSMSTGTNSIKIHKPMYKSSIQYWKHYENHLKPLMEIIKT